MLVEVTEAATALLELRHEEADGAAGELDLSVEVVFVVLLLLLVRVRQIVMDDVLLHVVVVVVIMLLILLHLVNYQN